MKRKLSTTPDDEVEECVMIKCKKFIFAPKNNQVVNFCYKLGKDFDSEPEGDHEEDVEEREVPIVAEQQEVSGSAEIETENNVSDAGPVIELVEDNLITPVASSENFQVSEQCDDEKEPQFEARPETPVTNPSTVPEPESPEENRMLRKMKISDGRYIVSKDTFIEVLRAKKAIEEEKKLLKQHWEEFDARVKIMAKLEAEMSSRYDEHFNVKSNEVIVAATQIEEAYKQELSQERAIRGQLEIKISEMATFIQQNMRHYQSYERAHQQQQQQHIYNEQQRIQSEQQAEMTRNIQNSQHTMMTEVRNQPEPNCANLPNQPMSGIQQLEEEEMRRRREQELREEESKRLEAQRLEMERQRMQAQRDEQRRLEMRKMQHMRHFELSKPKPASADVDEKIRQEQERLFSIQEEKSKSTVDPFAALKNIPNIFGWKGPAAPSSSAAQPPKPRADGHEMETDQPSSSTAAKNHGGKPNIDLSQFRRGV